ncbi:mucin-4 isoform X18 [Bactrocera dorsalis]|uniref:Mucin-4 isoform X18 n=1 Tax=Bactrocera dorsalis TaxID=27457 RepID=A0ABM3JIQ9_BACDO|nr:mucin-4 isoform X18 [Bactrocera dorsalis]
MDLSLERDSSSALGSLFQQIINDLKNTSPLWEDFVTKATKLHQCLRAAIQAIAAYLDAFQKIADAATNSRGASKEIGTALTRVCLRHKAVESRLKTFTTAIMDCLVQPLQEKLEDWKRTVITIDKEHAKEYKRCRTELKKRSSDTLRLQKKARKGQSDTIQSLMDSHKQDVTLRRAELEEVEKKSLRSAMIEERLRYCTFVHMLQPVVKEECEVMSELGHLQEAMDSIALVTKEPSVLPQASEELIHDTKATMSLYPESPGGGSSSQGGCSNSLGSRKSSVCSISSMNSSGSSNSPGHHHYPRSLSQLISPAIRLKPGESSDSGFCSSPALTTQATTATSQSHAVSTWPPHSQDAVPVLPPASDRPHTISTAYEKGHQRPPLTVYTFQNPETILEGSGGSGSIPGTPNGTSGGAGSGANTPSTQKSPAGALSRPPLPVKPTRVRCSSLERPLSANNNRSTSNLLQRQCPSPIPAHITKELSAHHAQQQHMQQQQQQQLQQQHLQTTSPPPTYVNMSELANMAAAKITNQQQQQPVANLQQQHSIDSISSQFSNDSTASGYQLSQQQQSQHQSGVMVSANNNSSGSKTRSHSVSSSSASSNTPSLHSHPSIESGTIATPLVGQTPTPSSGSSTPQNHYSPLLTNSPSSTAAGTPSGGSVTSGMLSGFVYNVNSPTPPQSGTASVDSDVLKITETDAAGQQPTIIPAHETNAQQQQTSNTTNNNAMNNATCIESQTTPTETSEQTYTNATDSTVTANDTESPTIVENDERSRASVLQKASMFEKQAAAAAAAVTPGRSTVEAIYGTRRTPDEVYRAANTSAAGNHYQQPSPQQQQQQQQQQHVEQQEVDKSFEDSIQELNNLIGELDSFQREIDASKRATTATAPTPTADETVGDNCGDRPFPLIGTSSNSVVVVADSNQMSSNAKAITTLADTEAERVDTTTPLTVICPPRPPKSPQCASNQTSGCGTDLSDTASDDVAADVGSLTSINNNHNNNNNTKSSSNNNEHNTSLSSRESCATGGNDNNGRTLQQYNSDSELSRCYVSETSSLAGGYENPTFAHFATAVSSSSIAASSGVDEPADVGSVIGDNRSLMAVSSTTTADDCASHTSDTYQTPQQVADNGSDGGSNVVVIYDHQIPITPDIDYVKQNSEIVVLRTKDPLQQQLGRQEMRELTQLPTSLCAPHDGLAAPGAGMMSVLALSSSSLSCLGPTSPPHTATVAPAKQRLSSFRASSEQQLQLLGCGDNNNSGSELSLLRTPHHRHHQQYANAGGVTRIARRSSVNTAKPPPPVRRSSSVTPSHNATGTAATQLPQQNQQQQQHYQHPQQLHHLHPHANQQPSPATTTTIQNSHYDTVDSLPPPPAYLLDSRQAQSSTPTPPPPSAVSASAIPSSSLKVAETVKALSAMRHKPASPNAIRHMQQQQQQLQHSHQSLQFSPIQTPTPSSPSPTPTPIQLQQNIYSTTVKTFSSTALLPPDSNTEQTLHYDAYSYYNPYMEVSRTTTQLTSAKMPLTNANHANAAANEAAYQTLPITPTSIYYYDAVTTQPTTTIATTPMKSQYLQSNALPDTYGVHTTIRNTPTKANNPPVSPSYTSPPPYDFQHSKIELPPPLPPPNPNQQRSLKQQQHQQQQQKQFADHQYNTQATSTPHPTQYQYTNNNNQLQQKRQHEQIYDYLPSHQHLHHSPKLQHKPPQQQQQQPSQIQQQQQQQQLAHHLDALMIDNEDEATVYSDNASFRTSSPGIYAQPKIVTSMSSFRSGSPAPTNDHHNQHHHVIPPTQPKTNPNLIAQLSARLSKQNQQQHTSDGIYGSTPNSPNHHNMHQQQQQQQHQHQHHQSEPVYMRNYTHPHHQQQQQMSSVATGSMHQQQNYDAAQTPKHQSSYAPAGGVARQQQLQQQQQQQHHPHHREPHTHSCPPPLENPPPPPTNSSIYAATANATATMPKNAMRSNAGATYAPPTATMTLPKNLAQQRLQQQQHYQQQQQQQHYQQQQYQQSTAIGANAAAQQHHQSQQHSQTATVNQRAQMPLPHQQQQQQQMSYKQKSATLQSNHRQPPIPSRHSSVQQKIFVATNPFIQTTTIHCHSPASVHSQPASPTCSSPSSLASIYGTSSRSHHHHHHQQQQQQQHQHHGSGSGSGVGGGAAGNGYYAAPHNPTGYASSNIEKAGSIRSKTKAEFLENLNAKLAKQGLSGRAFAVRNLINSKALMYQNPQILMRPSAQYRAQPQPQAPPTPPTSSAEESSSH